MLVRHFNSDIDNVVWEAWADQRSIEWAQILKERMSKSGTKHKNYTIRETHSRVVKENTRS